MNLEKLMRNKVESLQKKKKQYIAAEQSTIREEEETNQSILHRDSPIASVGDENLELEDPRRAKRKTSKIFGQARKYVTARFLSTSTNVKKDSESMLLLYDSRISRPNQGDVVLVPKGI
uniref:Uncharacterized protein n=1 Tax=Globodera rostochiensis TaxID=31243 RepID=A0A914HWY2_GLORO